MRGRNSALLLVLLWSAVWVTGCGGSFNHRMEEAFPTRAELMEIAQHVREEAPEARPTVDAWELEGPLPDQIGFVEMEPSGPLERAISEASGRNGPPLVESLNCDARETARYYRSTGEHPPSDLAEFISRQCGCPTAGVGHRVLHGDGFIPGEAELVERWGEDLEEMAEAAAAGGAVHIGVGWLGDDGGAAVVASYTFQEMSMEAIPAVSNGSSVTIRGSLDVSRAGHLLAAVTRGPWDTERCTVNAAVDLPEFEVTCELDPADDLATVELSHFARNAILGRTLVSLSVSPSGNRTMSYQRVAGEDTEGPVVASRTEQVVAAINRVREAAGRAPLALEVDQSAFVAGLAPAYTDSQVSEDERSEEREQIMLGVMAGWELSQPVSGGQFSAQYGAVDERPEEFVSGLLAGPSSRETIMSPEVNAIALGADERGGGGYVLVGTYQYASMADPEAVYDEVLRLIAERRDARGLQPMGDLGRSVRRGIERAIVRVVDDGRDPMRALRVALSQAAMTLNSAVSGYDTVGTSPEDLIAGIDWLDERRLEAEFVVAQYQPPGYPWHVWIVLSIRRA